MPDKMERELRKEANKHKDWPEERKDKYVYGAMRKAGWTPSTQKKRK